MGQTQSNSTTPSTTTSKSTKYSQHTPAQFIDAPHIFQALEYLSKILWRKTQTHHTFIVFGKAVLVLFFRSQRFTKTVNILPTTTISTDSKLHSIFINAVQKCAAKYRLPSSWLSEHISSYETTTTTTITAITDVERQRDEEKRTIELISHSLDQNIIIYTSDGLSLLVVDIVYEFKCQLHKYSESLTRNVKSGDENDLDDIVELLRRLVMVENHGQDILRADIEARYPYLVCTDEAWNELSRAYFREFGERGVLLDAEVTRS